MVQNSIIDDTQELEYYIPNMDSLFKNLYIDFQNQEFKSRNNLPTFGGIYVFYKDGNPVYVGRADNIRNRIYAHTRQGSGSESANFAFNLSRLELKEKVNQSKLGRKELLKEKWFSEIFLKHKMELFASKIRCIKIENDILQTMFEPYLALKLKTYPINNTFENH